MNGYDLVYGLGLAVGAPVWLAHRRWRRKVIAALRQRMGRGLPPRAGDGPGILIHAVSLGEINATRALVEALRRRVPGARFLVTTTTRTGWDRARQLYGAAEDVALLRYPLDFSCAIRRMLEAFGPDVAVLMELEVWPNFVSHCCRRKIPVVLVNGRLTEPSFRRYRLLRPVVKRMFGRLAAVAAQEQAYAERFAALGALPERIAVTGTMKFDTAEVAGRIAGDGELARAVGLGASAPVWVCGSTGPGEEAIVLEVYRRLLQEHPALRLVVVPRHPERFDEVAGLLHASGLGVLRRSSGQPPPANQRPIILGDTMGELRRFYSLATVVFVGRTLVDLGPRQHGSDMIEPAALAKPTAVGPYTGNFAEAIRALVAADAIACVDGSEGLYQALRRWLGDPATAGEMGRRAQGVVRAQRGATQRHAELVVGALAARRSAG